MVNRNSFQEQFKREVKKSKRYRKSLLKTSKMLDKDGYPTNECLEIIKKWHFSDPEGWFKFIKKYWRHSSFGWNEEDGLYGFDKKVHRIYMSTAGWSGNESIIIAMEQNVCMWNVVWFQSQRGGHYIFEIYKVCIGNGGQIMFEAEQTFGNDHCQYYLDIETVYGDWMHWGRYTSLEHVIRAATNTVYAYKKDNSLSGSFNIKKVGLT